MPPDTSNRGTFHFLFELYQRCNGYILLYQHQHKQVSQAYQAKISNNNLGTDFMRIHVKTGSFIYKSAIGLGHQPVSAMKNNFAI